VQFAGKKNAASIEKRHHIALPYLLIGHGSASKPAILRKVSLPEDLVM
jgi:hypothetical protein